jgi:hypothetical protein
MSSPEPLATPELPSARRLLRSTAIAAVVAAAILVTVVLPAEYGIDPTGVGRILGLKEMGDIKMALAMEELDEAAEHAATKSAPSNSRVAEPTLASSAAVPADSMKSDVTELTLAPNQGKEIKLVMVKDARVQFAWTTDRAVVNFDTHADNPSIKYYGYAKGTAAKADSGVLVAAFDGHHGWFWRNRSTDTVTITLRTSGSYRELKRIP